MKEDARKLVEEIQASMVKSARDAFEEPELDALRCLIRLTIEFHDFLQNGHPELGEVSRDYPIKLQPKELKLNELEYSIESIFSGIESFCRVNWAYRVLVGATDSRLEWGMVTDSSLRQQFAAIYHEFIIERQFEKKCRSLLDLFKIQIVFAGMFYG
jgi:hypothetical protein